MPVSAVIIVDFDDASSRLGRHFPSGHLVETGNANYMMARSHAWRRYQRGEQGTRGLFAYTPYSVALSAVSTRPLSVRNHIARAHAYRLGDRW